MKLSEFLTIKNLSAKDFAATVKVSEASVSNWASGESLPRLKQMREIFTATGGMVTPNDFCGITPTLAPLEGQTS